MTAKKMSFSLVNGRSCSELSIADRGLAYGDGLFETMRMEHGVIPLLGMHMERLERGCLRLSIPYESGRLQNDLSILLKSVSDAASKAHAKASGLVKVIYTRGEGGSGYRPPTSCTSVSIIINAKILPLSSIADLDGVILHLCNTRLPRLPQLAGIKHLNRLQYVLAAQELPDGEVNHGLLLDSNACVIETLHHNLFFVKDNFLFTPSLIQAGVAGVMRSLLVNKLIPSNFPSLEVKESDVSLDDLREADEVFVSNSIRGVWHVSQFENRFWSKGPVVMRLQHLISKVWSEHYDKS